MHDDAERTMRIPLAAAFIGSIVYALALYTLWLFKNSLYTYQLFMVFAFFAWSTFSVLYYKGIIAKTHNTFVVQKKTILYTFFASRPVLFLFILVCSGVISLAAMTSLLTASQEIMFALLAAILVFPFLFWLIFHFVSKVLVPWFACSKAITYAVTVLSVIYACSVAILAWIHSGSVSSPVISENVPTASTISFFVINLANTACEMLAQGAHALTGAASSAVGPSQGVTALVRVLHSGAWLLINFVGCVTFLMPSAFLALPRSERRRIIVADLMATEQTRFAKASEIAWAAFWGVLFSGFGLYGAGYLDALLQRPVRTLALTQHAAQQNAETSTAEAIVGGARAVQKKFLQLEKDVAKYIPSESIQMVQKTLESDLEQRKQRRAELRAKLIPLRDELRSAYLANVDDFLEWQFSMFNDYELLYKKLTSEDIEAYVQKKMVETLSKGVSAYNQREYDKMIKEYYEIPIDAASLARLIYRDAVSELPADALVETLEDYPGLKRALENIKGFINNYEKLTHASAFAANHSVAGLAAIASAKGAGKLGAKAFGKLAAKMAAKKGTAAAASVVGGAAAGAATGAAAGSIVPGIGTAIGGAVGGLAGGVATWLGVDFLWASAEEYLKRDDAKKEVTNLINEWFKLPWE